MTYNEKIIDALTGEETWREYTAKEMQEVETAELERQKFIQAEATRAAEKAALFAKLGITEDEARLLLGGN